MSIWNCGLLIMRESNAYDDGNVRQLWDLLCKDEVEAVYRDGGSTADALRALCSQVIDLAGALGATPWCAAHPSDYATCHPPHRVVNAVAVW